MTLANLLSILAQHPETLQFIDIITTIDQSYTFTPTAFQNGPQRNDPGQNSGSCKIFGFAKLHALNEQQTLHCFGDYYRRDVLENPHGNDHLNIRSFMDSGWSGVAFEGEPLKTIKRNS